MDSNYEAQKQFTRLRLEARRRQADAERLLLEGRSARKSGLKQFFMRLFQRSSSRAERRRARQSARPSASEGRTNLARRRFG